jgi:phosphoribosylaminoimidazole-succinocarboxamide synthase
MNHKLIYSGSVKDIFQKEESPNILFKFSDRYSVFDWGEMPDMIENKGKSLALMGKFFFENLNINSHYINYLEDGSLLEVEKVDVHWPKKEDGRWEYFYSSETRNALVPLEVIFRLGMPQGSSLVKRLDSKYLNEIGLKNAPNEGDMFEKPIIEFSTKLEPEDRYLTYKEAKEIAQLSEDEFKKLIEQAQQIALKLNEIFKKLDIELWDGKVEFAFNENRDFKLVDTVGIDELRLLYKGKQLSKEFLRQYYKATSWYDAIEESKKVGNEKNLDWKEYCQKELNSNPSKLPSELKTKVENLYMNITNALYSLNGEKPFNEQGDWKSFLESF